MTRLFIEVYLDEDVSVLVAELIRARGFQATTTLEAGQLGSSDAQQLEFATNQEKAIITHNRVDFESLARDYFEAGRGHCGIMIASRRTPYEITQRLLRILNHVTADEMRNQIRYI